MKEIISEIITEAPKGLYNLLIFLGAGLGGLITGSLLFKIVKIFLKDIHVSTSLITQKFRLAFQLLLLITALNFAIPFTSVTRIQEVYIHKALYISLVISFSYLLIKITEFVKALLYIKFDVTAKDNLNERKARTQIDFLQKFATTIIIFIAVAIVLMSFSRVRELGTSILASAGIAGIIVGLAAQKSLTNLLAGFQIAFTQPIRLDDVVIVENEWGRIEEITLTYVVVRIWDLRRLVVPISYFIDKPFQNWTRVSAEILGTVFIYTDYTISVDEIRKELTRILKNEGKQYWDGKLGMVQVTNTSEKGIELRALVSSASADHSWDLRCLIREQLIAYIQKNYPEALPRIRLEQQVGVEQ
jgi:small-conductance mechanosensitive channel